MDYQRAGASDSVVAPYWLGVARTRHANRSRSHVDDHERFTELSGGAAVLCPVEQRTGEQRIAIRGLSWELYDALSNAIDARQHVYLAYDGKDLEVMVKGRA